MVYTCKCGCGTRIEPVDNKGRARRYKHGHNGRKARFVTSDRYTIVAECWMWNGHIGDDGYGRTGGMTAHRKSYAENVGPIPPGAHIDHLCRNRSCVNPAHLEPVTSAENTRRGNMGKKLNAIQARAIANDPRSGAAVALEYGVTRTIVSRIRSGLIWVRATGINPKEAA